MAVATDAITVRHLSKTYAARDGAVAALDRTTFGVAEGEFVAVVGPSGCGKSTLLKILAGILPASSGEARLRGTPIAGPRRDIGVVFQSPVLFPWRTVLDNVRLPVDVQRLAGTAISASASSCSRSSASPGSSGSIRGSSPAACSNASPSRGRSSTTRPCC